MRLRNWLRKDVAGKVMVVLVVLILAYLVAMAFKKSGTTEVTLSMMVKIGDGDWQSAACTARVEGDDEISELGVWGVRADGWFVTNNVQEIGPRSNR